MKQGSGLSTRFLAENVLPRFVFVGSSIELFGNLTFPHDVLVQLCQLRFKALHFVVAKMFQPELELLQEVLVQLPIWFLSL